MPAPWAYVRRLIARSWGVPPWQVDEAPWIEIDTELRILGLEGQAAARRQLLRG